MSHARIEEVSDSDPDEMDIEDLDLPAGSIMAPRHIPAPGTMQPPPREILQAQPPTYANTQRQAAEKERSKNWQCLYPVYFDSNRSKAEGRRVGKEAAVPNPLAREIVDAVQNIGAGINIVFEPGKTHPKDWSNPGRVRVDLKGHGSKKVKNKHHLYQLVSAYLKSHPANEHTPNKLPIQGLPPQKEYIAPAVPKGWKISTILPLHSPALSGGGVSENFLKEMMGEMGMGGPERPESSGGEKKKKDKKKGKA